MRQEEAVRVDVGDEGVEEGRRVREEAVRVEGLGGGGAAGGGGEEGGEEGEGAGLGGGVWGLGVWLVAGAWFWWAGECREGGVSGGRAEGEEGCCSWGAEGAHFEGERRRCAGGREGEDGGLEVVIGRWWGSRCRTCALGGLAWWVRCGSVCTWWW